MGTTNYIEDVVTLAAVTMSEFVGLLIWMALMDSFHVASVVVLWFGLFVERLSLMLWLRKLKTTQQAAHWPQIAAFAAAEAAIWSIWIVVAKWLGAGPGLVALMVLMHVLHCIESASNGIKHLRQLLTEPLYIIFALLEVLGAWFWLRLTTQGNFWLGASALLFGLTIEHLLQGVFIKRSIANTRANRVFLGIGKQKA